MLFQITDVYEIMLRILWRFDYKDDTYIVFFLCFLLLSNNTFMSVIFLAKSCTHIGKVTICEIDKVVNVIGCQIIRFQQHYQINVK